MRRPPRSPSDTQAIVERLKTQAARQAGALHRSQLLAQQLSSDEILGWAARGRLEARFRWTYVFPGTGHSLTTRAWCATLSVGADAVVSHTQALALLDVLPEIDGPFHCTRPGGRPRPQPGLIVHETDYLPPEDVVDVGGVRCAAFHRAVLGLCEKGTAGDVDRALDRGVHLRLFQHAAFERLIREAGNVPGRATLEAALGRLNETAGRKRSELERRLTELIVNSDLPTPLINAIVGGFEVDNHWFGTRAIVEADGRESHSSPADIARDIEKQRALEALGYVILRVTWHQVVYEPDRTLKRIEAFLLANLQPPIVRVAAA